MENKDQAMEKYARFAAAPRAGDERKGEGSLLGTLGDLLNGDN